MENNILQVKNLKVSFRTSNGVLKAVRDISFDVKKGKTLAIVGESGSGKSVTSKAILGILQGNSIIEGGEILYDGKDLLSLSEDDIHSIRGDKVSMIFQDPLSSLNPISKIGPQICEAMLLKNKSGRKESRKQFNDFLKLLSDNMKKASPDSSNKIDEMIKTFDQFVIKANQLENSYNKSLTLVETVISNLNDFLYLQSRRQKVNLSNLIKNNIKSLEQVDDKFFLNSFDENYKQIILSFKQLAIGYKFNKDIPSFIDDDKLKLLKNIKDFLVSMTAQEQPVFFRYGYYLISNPNANLLEKPVEEMNVICRKYLDDNFMFEFIKYIELALVYSNNQSIESKKIYINKLKEAIIYFSQNFEKKDAINYVNNLTSDIGPTIDYLNLNKDMFAYTFKSSLMGAIDKYFKYKLSNPKEEKRFNQKTIKREALLAKGKHVDWSVVPKNILDLDELKSQIVYIIERLIKNYEQDLNSNQYIDFNSKAIAIVDHLKEVASKVVFVLSKSMAKEKAIKLMEEVGIAEPRRRFEQYPFEFSGGMRQRIVIAIALAADPEVLICDEPTTALDVTIQAQILELINRLKKERNLSIIFITHDLGVVAQMADDVAVMYAGKIVEYGSVNEIYYDPKHPYTWALLSSMPDLDTKDKLEAIAGTPPNLIYPPIGDAFAPRNKYAMQIDFEEQPPMFKVSDTHYAATWLLHEYAPKVEMPQIIKDRIERMKIKGK